jgi:hypothetical protein
MTDPQRVQEIVKVAEELLDDKHPHPYFKGFREGYQQAQKDIRMALGCKE